jgi:type IV pilus assembly protein PilM
MFENVLGGKKDFIGLDIGYNSLKIVELKKRGAFLYLSGFSELPIPANSIQKNGIIKKKEISEQIKRAIRDSKPHAITGKKIASALPASLVFSKVLKFPNMKKAELDKAIPYEVTDFFPVPIEELNLDWHVLNTSTGKGYQKDDVEVLVIGAPKKLVNDLIEIVHEAGLELNALETKPIAAARGILFKNNGLVVLVDIGAEITSISIADSEQIKITSTINAGGNIISRNIASVTGLSIDQAEKNKIINGLDLDIKDKTNDEIINNLNIIIQEIKDNVKYYETRINRNTRVSEILLFGGGAELKGADKYLEKELSIPTKLANPNLKIKTSVRDQIPQKEILKYTAAIGLAMRES